VANDLAAALSAIRAIAEGPIAADAARIDSERAFPVENLHALGEAGALGLLVPPEHRGADRARGGGRDARVGVRVDRDGLPDALRHRRDRRGRRRPRAGETLAAMASGRSLGTLAFSERGTGAHFYAPELAAERSNGHVRVTGRKSFVTGGGHADVYLILVRGDVDGTADAYLVRGDDPRVRADGTWNGLGMAGNSSVALELDGVELTDAERIGSAGEAIGLVFTAVAPFFLVGLAAVNVGIAAAAAAAATAHAPGRCYPDGTSVAEVQAVQHLLADMDVAVRQARLLVREAARLGEAGDAAALVAIMEAKVAATDTAAAVTQRALEVTGGQGYTPALPIERHLRDARAGAVMAPTNAVLRTWIGKALAGLPVP
jgi:alkylation response protein AidB-like acyl-CoA dehydrogenase